MKHGTFPQHPGARVKVRRGEVRYFEEAAALSNASPTGQPDVERLAALARKYGVEFVSPSPR